MNLYKSLWLELQKMEKVEKLNKSDEGQTVYHGSNQNFDKFDVKHQKSGFYPGIYTTHDKERAKEHGSIVHEARLKGKHFELKSPEHADKVAKELGVPHSGSGHPLARKLQDMGYTGIKRGSEYITFHHDNVEKINPVKKSEGLEKGEKGDWQKEGYEIHFKNSNQAGRKFVESNPTHLKHLYPENLSNNSAYATKNGVIIGHAQVADMGDGTFKPIDLKVHPDHHRKGIASALYSTIERSTGKKIVPSSNQTPEAKALWGNPNRSFGKAEGMEPKKIAGSGIDHKSKLSGPHFLFSAENPKHPHKDQIKTTHSKLLTRLQNTGHDAHEVHGHYGSPEKSIVVYGVNKKGAEKLHSLASKMGQDSSIYSTGKEHEMRFHHGTDAGKKIKGTGTVWHENKPKDFYTTLPNGAHFTHNFDFEKSEESAEPLKLEHYSNRSDLKSIDPKFQGKGVDARTKGRGSDHPHAFFYRAGSTPENVVSTGAKSKYTVHVDPKTQPLYDIGEDKHGFVEQARKENNGALNMDNVFKKIKDSGHHGFYNTKHPHLSHVVAMFHPQEVKAHDKL